MLIAVFPPNFICYKWYCLIFHSKKIAQKFIWILNGYPFRGTCSNMGKNYSKMSQAKGIFLLSDHQINKRISANMRTKVIFLLSDHQSNKRIYAKHENILDFSRQEGLCNGQKGPHIIFCVIVRVIPDFGVSTAIILSSKHFPYVVQVGLWTLEKEVVNCKIEHENSKFAV